VHPRNRNKINNTGIGTPNSQSATHPTLPDDPFFFFSHNFMLQLSFAGANRRLPALKENLRERIGRAVRRATPAVQ